MDTRDTIPTGLIRRVGEGDAPPRILVVILHGWGGSAAAMAGVGHAAELAFPGAALDIFTPELPHARWWRCSRAVDTVVSLLLSVDKLVAELGPYDKIILVGHSMGATLARRLFLAAVGPIPGEFQAEEALAAERPRVWASRVERIVLIAAFNRGWQISPRMSWYYAIGFNVIGLFGHVFGQLLPKIDLLPSIFDIRLGAPFITQTRLNWMAYRRHSDKDRTGPLLLQLIGTQDDLISPFDQVDIAVDGLEQDIAASGSGGVLTRRLVSNVQQRSYFLLTMQETDHDTAIDFEGPLGRDADEDKRNRDAARAREEMVRQSLMLPKSALDSIATDPDLLSDEVTRPDSRVERTVFVIHGIRDDGFWTHRIAEKIRDLSPQNVTFRAWTPTYGYFAMLPFILPWIRREKVEWFMDQYASARAEYPNAVFDYVGHSNGTYLGARALVDYPDCRFNHVYFAGSVVRRDYQWVPLIDAARVSQFINAIATTDWVVALLPKSVERWGLDLGGAGVDGFDDAYQRPRLKECRYVKGGHGAGIAEGHWDAIAAFIVNGETMVPDFTEKNLFQREPNARLAWWSQWRLGIPVLVLVGLVGLPVLIYMFLVVISPAPPLSLYLLLLLVYALAVIFLINRV